MKKILSVTMLLVLSAPSFASEEKPIVDVLKNIEGVNGLVLSDQIMAGVRGANHPRQQGNILASTLGQKGANQVKDDVVSPDRVHFSSSFSRRSRDSDGASLNQLRAEAHSLSKPKPLGHQDKWTRLTDNPRG
ncbi:MAG: hypothetical protein V3T17_07180 [Pseudomonadales bacterium]